jgi:hypothetical protein
LTVIVYTLEQWNELILAGKVVMKKEDGKSVRCRTLKGDGFRMDPPPPEIVARYGKDVVVLVRPDELN